MKKLLILGILTAAFMSGITTLQAQSPAAQSPAAQKPATTAAPASTQTAPKNIKTDDKKEELCKRLLERKNELRKEEHERAKERRTETKEKSNPK